MWSRIDSERGACGAAVERLGEMRCNEEEVRLLCYYCNVIVSKYSTIFLGTKLLKQDDLKQGSDLTLLAIEQ